MDNDIDLVSVKGASGQAKGQVAHVFDRLLDTQGRPLTNALVEIWQCDAHGYCHYTEGRGGGADPDFQGFGCTSADRNGRYRF